MNPGGDDAESLWREIAELWMAASLGEIARGEAISMMLDASARTLGVACAVLDRGGAVRFASRPPPADGARRTSHTLRDGAGQPSGSLVFYGEPPLLLGDRLARVASSILEGSSDVSRKIHKLRNKLMALAVNIELIEEMTRGADPALPLLGEVDRAERRNTLEAIALSAEAVRELIRMLERSPDDHGAGEESPDG